MLTVTDSHRDDAETRDPRGTWGRLGEIADRLWPHLAAWGLAALLAFFAVRERMTIMEKDATALLERVRNLEKGSENRDAEVRGIRDDTTRIRTLLEVLAREYEERRADDRARIRQQQGERE